MKMKTTTMQPETSALNPRASPPILWGRSPNLRASLLILRTSSPNPRASPLNLRTSSLNLLGRSPNLRTSPLNLRTSSLNLLGRSPKSWGRGAAFGQPFIGECKRSIPECHALRIISKHHALRIISKHHALRIIFKCHTLSGRSLIFFTPPSVQGAAFGRSVIGGCGGFIAECRSPTADFRSPIRCVPTFEPRSCKAVSKTTYKKLDSPVG